MAAPIGDQNLVYQFHAAIKLQHYAPIRAIACVCERAGIVVDEVLPAPGWTVEIDDEAGIHGLHGSPHGTTDDLQCSLLVGGRNAVYVDVIVAGVGSIGLNALYANIHASQNGIVLLQETLRRTLALNRIDDGSQRVSDK
jgi:hypothetical protein